VKKIIKEMRELGKDFVGEIYFKKDSRVGY
jgi:hypothetical protein